MRYLRLYLDSVGSDLPPLLEDEIQSFLKKQADAVWHQAESDPQHLVDFEWNRTGNETDMTPQVTNAVTQTSGLDALLAAYGI